MLKQKAAKVCYTPSAQIDHVHFEPTPAVDHLASHAVSLRTRYRAAAWRFRAQSRHGQIANRATAEKWPPQTTRTTRRAAARKAVVRCGCSEFQSVYDRVAGQSEPSLRVGQRQLSIKRGLLWAAQNRLYCFVCRHTSSACRLGKLLQRLIDR